MKRGSVDMDFLGTCFGANISSKSGGYTLTLLVNDDGKWYPAEFSADVHHIPDMITVLGEALAWLKANTRYPYK